MIDPIVTHALLLLVCLAETARLRRKVRADERPFRRKGDVQDCALCGNARALVGTLTFVDECSHRARPLRVCAECAGVGVAA